MSDESIPSAEDPDYVNLEDVDRLLHLVNDYRFSCNFQQFLDVYGPARATDSDVQSYIELMCKDLAEPNGTTGKAVFRQTESGYEWVAFPALPREQDECSSEDEATIEDKVSTKGKDPYESMHAALEEAVKHMHSGESIERPKKKPGFRKPSDVFGIKPEEVFAPVSDAIRSIYAHGNEQMRTNDLGLKKYPRRRGSGKKWRVVQACIAEKEWDDDLKQKMDEGEPISGSEKPQMEGTFREAGRRFHLPISREVIPIAFSDMTYGSAQNNIHRMIFAESFKILSRDPRRTWIHAVTFENQDMILWLFSTTHQVSSIAINWIKDIKSFVLAWLTFSRASPLELGIDPLVHRVSGDPSYIYEFTSTKQKEPIFYKTVENLDAIDMDFLCGNTTRIWKATQVYSVENPTPIVEGKVVALKATWMHENTQNEAETQDNLFASVDTFISNPSWRGDSRLKDFDEKIVDKLASLFDESKRYRDLFATILHAEKGMLSKPPPRHGVRVVNNNPNGASHIECWGIPIQVESREISAKTMIRMEQSRVVYEEVSKQLYLLPTVGDAMNVVDQTLTALQIMLCAGWVHRDISPSTMLSVYSAVDKVWQLKLTGLKYAQVFSDPLHDPKIGVQIGLPQFLPTEILNGKYLLNELDATVSQSRLLQSSSNITIPIDADFSRIPKATAPVLYNFQHDFEQLWWAVLWCITHIVKYAQPNEYISDFFTFQRYQIDLTGAHARYRRFIRNFSLDNQIHPKLKNFEDFLCTVRPIMLEHYLLRAAVGQMEKPSAYSKIAGIFAKEFQQAYMANREIWQNIPNRRYQTSIIEDSVMDN